MRHHETFSERYPDRARSGSSSNLIAGELSEARTLIPRLIDLRESEVVLERRRQRMDPRWTPRTFWAAHRGRFVAGLVTVAYCAGIVALLRYGPLV